MLAFSAGCVERKLVLELSESNMYGMTVHVVQKLVSISIHNMYKV